MSNVNGNYFWSDNYSWYNQVSALAPVMVMITITKLELNLKCSIPVLVTCPKAVLNLNSKFTELCEVVSIVSSSLTV